jgi:malonyl-CoA decarboxylase
MTFLAQYFVLDVKSGGRPEDPVARFHLGNGACVESVNWMADTSRKGLRQSCSLMVNYRYDLAALHGGEALALTA